MLSCSTHAPGWEPPHCPNPKCSYHKHFVSCRDYIRKGSFRRRSVPTFVRRFQCKHCGIHFSSQTFSTTYWQKRPELTAQLLLKVSGGMAARQAARDLAVAPETVHRHLARLARHCLLFHLKACQAKAVDPVVVADGFESFEWSQYFPFHHNVLIESSSDFVVYCTDSELRRKGTMTAGQKRRRSELETLYGRPDRKAIRKGMRELFAVALRGLSSGRLETDEHPSYPPALREARLAATIEHRRTSSRRARTRANPLAPVNVLDRLIRHSNANHRRETIAWSRRRQASCERLLILLVWRNYIKRRAERGEHRTPAMLRGIFPRRLTVEDILATRLFASHYEIPPRWQLYYQRRVLTRAIARQRFHSLKYAY